MKPVTAGVRPRAVGALRLSRYTDASTSVEVQTETIQQAGDAIGAEFVGWAQDVDVSALKTTPWEREGLRAWLDDPDAWDVLIWQRMDRAVRSMADMADLGRYAKRHGKRLVFASGPGGARLELDFSSPMSEMIMLILAFAAQLEGQAITERNQGAAAYLQSLGRWSGGIVPYGFIPVRRAFPDGKEGWWLAADEEETANVVREMVRLAIAEKSYSEITRYLNETNALTPKNHRGRLATPPREVDPAGQWRVTVVRDILLSPMLRGEMVRRSGELVRAADGAAVKHGEALIDDGTWYTLQEKLKKITRPELAKSRRKDAHPLLGVILCGTCDQNMYGSWYLDKKTGTKQQTFRCPGHRHAAGQPAMTIHAAPTLKFVEREFLKRFRTARRTQVVRTGGVDHRPEIAELKEAIAALSARLGGLRGAAADAVASQLQGRSDRLEELERQPLVPPRDELVYLDRTWGDDWQEAVEQVRRQMLLQAGIRVRVRPPVKWRCPAEDRLTFHVGEDADPLAAALADVEYQEAN
ncbi:recombinase family protein [Streptomyces sp. NPDC020096]